MRNRRTSREEVEATFRVEGLEPELWDPDRGTIVPVVTFRRVPGGISVPLVLDPYGSIFVVFRRRESSLPSLEVASPPASPGQPPAQVDRWDGTTLLLTVFQPGVHRIVTSDGRTARIDAEDIPAAVELAGAWDVSFAEGDGSLKVLTLANLASWTDQPDEGVRYFSGTADYRKGFQLAEDWLGDGRRIYLDLGDLWAIAEASLNDEPLGVLWKPPYRVEITPVAGPGENQLRVAVANTWSNRLVGDSRLPEAKRVTRTNVTGSGGRPWAEVPLIRSGLFGPVRLIPARTLEITLR